jgi:hypothetical protein
VRVRGWIEARNAMVAKQPRCKPESSLRGAQGRVQKYRLGGWVSVRLEGRQVVWGEDAPAREKEAQLDGCYVVQSDLPVAAATMQAVHDRYRDLTRVERDFRTLKTGLLEIRPVFLRKADQTRGHALVSLLALKLARALEQRAAPLGLTVDDAVERLKGVRLVCLGEAKLGLWRLADSYPAAQMEVLGALPKLGAPVLSLGKANRRRLSNPRQGRPSQGVASVSAPAKTHAQMGEEEPEVRLAWRRYQDAPKARVRRVPSSRYGFAGATSGKSSHASPTSRCMWLTLSAPGAS